MKKLLLSILAIIALSFSSIATNVNIPDANFKAYLVGNTSINTNGDSEIQVSEANAFTGSISCNSMSITDLTGIEAFTGIWALSCYANSLTSLDVSQNTSLTVLKCNANSITSLDLSQNISLSHLECNHNALTSLDLSNNSALTWLYSYSNPLTSLNLANGNNINLTLFNTTNSPNLTCIQVDDETWSNTNWTVAGQHIDATASFSTNCETSCTVNIPDANFKAYLVGNTSINTNEDNEIQCDEASAFTGIMDPYNQGITDLTGIEAFTGLTTLNCSFNSLSTLDISNNIALTQLQCNNNLLSSLDVSNNPNLTLLDCGYNSLSEIDIKNNLFLVTLFCRNNSITSLDLSQHSLFKSIQCQNNQLISLNLANGNNTNFIWFIATNNPNLSCIQVDDVEYSEADWSGQDAGASFSTQCSSVGVTSPKYNELKMYPNPADTDVQISKEMNEVSIFNVNGTKVANYKNVSRLNISELNPGLYMVISNDNGTLYQSRLIIK